MKKLATTLIIFIAALICILSIANKDSLKNDNNGATEQQQNEKENVLIDNEKVRVTYIGITEIDVETIGYSYLNLRIENKTDVEIWVTMPYCNVDKETVPFVMQGSTAIYIKPGDIYPATFGIQMFNLSTESLKNAKEIVCTLEAVNKENSSSVIFEETITIDPTK